MKNIVKLGVNIDHIATLRNARGSIYPEPVQAALLAEQAGADGITIHLREDRRHIKDRDVYLLNEVLQTRMNLEMAVTEEMLQIAEKVKPEFVCLVPEKREELTTEGGLDVAGSQSKISEACQRLRESGIKVSLFIDADNKQIESASRCGAPYIELHTGKYADLVCDQSVKEEYLRIVEGTEFAQSLGIIVNAGHGLHYHNVQPIAQINGIYELNIGHSIIARAVFVGLENAVKEMRQLMNGAI